MVKAVFFDLYHTLIGFEPPREETEARALRDLGVDVKPEVLRRPLVIADEFMHREIARVPLRLRSEEDRMSVYATYQALLLKEAGIKASEPLIRGVLDRMQQTRPRLVLFDDVMPALTGLKRQGLMLGLISNVDRDITSLLNELGLTQLLKVVVTSQEVGFNKPQPEIFQAALARSGAKASEAIYVGDQYRIDVIGAIGAGMTGMLLDRGDYFAEIIDCPRIQSLVQVADYL